jgi:hypothetical protein
VHPGVVALVEGLERSRPSSVRLHELLVVALERLLPVRGDADQAAEDVDRLELVGDEAERLKSVWGFSRKVRWLPNCWSHRIRDSVGRSMRTVSSSGRSRPSLKTSTAQMTPDSSSRDCARGAEVSPEWTATARRPCSLK